MEETNYLCSNYHTLVIFIKTVASRYYLLSIKIFLFGRGYEP